MAQSLNVGVVPTIKDVLASAPRYLVLNAFLAMMTCVYQPAADADT